MAVESVYGLMSAYQSKHPDSHGYFRRKPVAVAIEIKDRTEMIRWKIYCWFCWNVAAWIFG